MNLPIRHFLLLVVLVTSFAALAEEPAADGPAFGRDDFSDLVPQELQFSDGVTGDPSADRHAAVLATGDPADRLAAAEALWRGRSRPHAAAVVEYLTGAAAEREDHAELRREVADALRPESILRELKAGDYRWGAWLAFLRPHPSLVPALLAGLEDHARDLPATILALGKSRDPRALASLLELLGRKDYQTPGHAARALGYFGGPKVERPLIKALAADNGWRAVNACLALAKVGGPEAIPALEKLANDRRFWGALNVRGCARRAVEQITAREER
jgi:HEAT repeat protein